MFLLEIDFQFAKEECLNLILLLFKTMKIIRMNVSKKKKISKLILYSIFLFELFDNQVWFHPSATKEEAEVIIIFHHIFY